MGRLTVTVDEGLLSAAQKALQAPSKKETIRLALQEVVRRKHLANALAHQGKIKIDLDLKTLRRLRMDQ